MNYCRCGMKLGECVSVYSSLVVVLRHHADHCYDHQSTLLIYDASLALSTCISELML